MAVAEDASTPAVKRSAVGFTSATIVTAAFSPPAGSLLVAIVEMGYGAAFTTTPTGSISTSAGGFTWTQQVWQPELSRKFSATGIWTAPVPSAPGSITATFTRTGTTLADGMFALRVVTGANLTAVGTVVSVISLSSATTTTSLTPQSIGSQIYVGAIFDSSGGGFTPVASTTSLDNWTEDTTAQVTEGIGKSTSLTSSLSSVSYGYTNTGTAGTHSTTVNAIEILPIPTGGPRHIDVTTGISIQRSATY